MLLPWSGIFLSSVFMESTSFLPLDLFKGHFFNKSLLDLTEESCPCPKHPEFLVKSGFPST